MSFVPEAERRLRAQIPQLHGMTEAQEAVLGIARELKGVNEVELWPAAAVGSWRAHTAESATMDLNPMSDASDRMLVVPLWAGEEQVGALAVRAEQAETDNVARQLERFAQRASRVLKKVRDRTRRSQNETAGPTLIPVEAMVVELDRAGHVVTAVSRGALRFFGHDLEAWGSGAFLTHLIAPSSRARFERAVLERTKQSELLRLRAVDANATPCDLDVQFFYHDSGCQLVLQHLRAAQGSQAISSLVSSLSKAATDVKRAPPSPSERLALLELSEQTKREADKLLTALRPVRKRTRRAVGGLEKTLKGVMPVGVNLSCDFQATEEQIACAPAALTPAVLDLVVQSGLSAGPGGRVEVSMRTCQIGADEASRRSVVEGHYLTVRVHARSADPSIKPTRLRPQSELLIQNGGQWRFLGPSDVEFDLPISALDLQERESRGEVLLVVPDPVVLRGLVRLVTHLGFTPHGVATPSEALSFSQRCERRVDMVFVDLELSSARAWDLAERLETLHQGSKTVFLAQRGQTLSPEVTNGAVVLARPFSARELSEMFSTLLEQPLAAAG